MNKTKTIAVQLTGRRRPPVAAHPRLRQEEHGGLLFRCEEVDVSGPFFLMMIDNRRGRRTRWQHHRPQHPSRDGALVRRNRAGKCDRFLKR